MMTRSAVIFVCLISAGQGGWAAPSSSSPNSALMAQYYPRESLAQGEEGIVGFKIEIDRDARIESCAVTKSSGYPRLDAATCDLLVAHAHFSPAKSDGDRVASAKVGQLVWKLPDTYRKSAAAPPPATVTTAELDAQRLVCKRSKLPGSLIRWKTYCLTRDQWGQATADAQQQGQDMISPRQSDHGCRFGPGC